ncbi:MAG: S1 RNA-binding domain-containing protein [archaeon]
MNNNFEQLRKYEDDYYKKGDRIKVEITGVASYGAFIVTKNSLKISGLIHITEISEDFIHDPNDYFSKGDELIAEVISWDNEKHQLTLSTKYLNLTPKTTKQNNNNSNLNNLYKLSKIKKELEEEKNITSKKEEKLKEVYENQDFQNIIKFLNGKIGIVSPKAKEMLAELIIENGIFDFTITLTDIMEHFELDLGLQLAQKLKKDINKNKNVQYLIRDHTVYRLKERSEEFFDVILENKTNKEIKENIEKMCLQGKTIIKVENLKYISYGDWVFPCFKLDEHEVETWDVVTVLTWEMFEKNMQKKFEKYVSG